MDLDTLFRLYNNPAKFNSLEPDIQSQMHSDVDKFMYPPEMDQFKNWNKGLQDLWLQQARSLPIDKFLTRFMNVPERSSMAGRNLSQEQIDKMLNPYENVLKEAPRPLSEIFGQ